ncbi:MAG TPA: glycoside hydrolase family 25 protein [Tahibacter sp.]|uniref:glycoside hydrolase family 25 protein n=1 Tax=Tahibacter sp. TaxID=2056211 RepID=UPI002C8ACFD2|nr:glycoside hydrolase family 25 protein [Tahibacter sp.]HSX58886.1 glycoside hydrolase family 25 protein [Tahibacter sp.]
MINAVVDLSHHNASVDFSALAAAGVAGVIHKATQGAGYVDPTYAQRQAQARAAGLRWGAYHFGDGSDATVQAQHFLATANAAPGDLLALDIEQNTQGASMTLAQAEAFVQAVHQQTGRWPGVYGGSYLKQLLGSATTSVLGNCWLWISEYANQPAIAALWPSWTLWQYTDGSVGPNPHSVPGVGNCDRDMFNGDLATLQRWWAGG